MSLRGFCLITGSDGALATAPGEDLSTPVEVKALVQSLAGKTNVALHIHGGLVSSERALEDAVKLLPFYTEAGIHPIFIIWKTGPLETLENLLKNLFKEELFSILVRRLLGFVARKLGGEVIEGAVRGILPRDAGEPLPPPDDLAATIEFQKRKSGQEPLKTLDGAATSLASPAEQEQFEKELNDDGEFLEAAEKAARWIEDQEVGRVDPTFISRGVEGETQPTMIDKGLLVEPLSAEGVRARGFFSAAKLIKVVAVVGYKVVKRFHENRDHGAYATVVEELMRECYAAQFGQNVWGTMKRQARETFKEASLPRGGRVFLQEFAALLKGNSNPPRLSIVAHSAGCIYSCEMAKTIAEMKQSESLPSSFTFANVVFLAPACGFKPFVEAWTADPSLFTRFRMFALSDELERGYWEVPVIYPRSLLYLVSGALELEDDQSASAYDLPILGMERYFTEQNVYAMPEVKDVRRKLGDKAIWSIHNGGDGLRVDSREHGGFFFGADAKASQVMNSIVYLLKQE